MTRGLAWAFLAIFCRAACADPWADLSAHLGPSPALVVVCGESPRDRGALAVLMERTAWKVLYRSPPSDARRGLCAWALEQGFLDGRLSVVDADDPSLWLAGEMADAVWVGPGAAHPPSEAEILRVLRPGGIGLVAGKRIVKTAARGVDEWRHPYHGPDNNAVSQDRVARLPGDLRFQTHPVFAAMPNQTLFSGGRIFFFTGHIAFHEREEPLLNTLTVLNAYNGLRLWSRALDPRFVVHDVAKVAPEGEVLFAQGPALWLLDAATGKERGKLLAPPDAVAAGDTDWKWLAHENGWLWAALGPPDARVAPHKQKRQMGHWPWDVADAQYKGLVQNFGAARRLAAYQYPEMKLLWCVAENQPFDVRALCMKGGRIFQLSPGKYAAARDARTGKTLWRRTPDKDKALFEAIGGAIPRQGWGLGWATSCYARAADEVVCLAGSPLRKTIGVGFARGELLWTQNSESPHPFFFDDALYVVPRVAAPAACQVLDPRTGKVRQEFRLGVIGSCTRLTATPHQFFYRPGGGEGRTVYVDLGERKLADYEAVVRPGCFDGVVPANGRLYWMPLACDCWQVHGTFSMAPGEPLRPRGTAASPPWAAPAASTPAAADDWPMFRANAAGNATVPTTIPRQAAELWRRRLASGGLTAPVCAGGRVFVGGTDGAVRALDAATGKVLWLAFSHAPVTHPPAYWNGRVVFGSCDGFLYCVDAADGRLLGRAELTPERRWVNIMDRLMSVWPLGGGVVVGEDGTAYTAAGSTAADGAVVAAVDAATGTFRWRQVFHRDRADSKLSFGVQSNVLLGNKTFYVNGGAPVGIVALDAATGDSARVVARLEAGMEMFLEPDGTPCCTGPELYAGQSARTTIFKRHLGRLYFQFPRAAGRLPEGSTPGGVAPRTVAPRTVALLDGRLFCARDPETLDRLVNLLNKEPKARGTTPDILRAPTEPSILWAGRGADVWGLAVGADGLLALRRDRLEALSADGDSLWTAPLPAPPVRWGVALAGQRCLVTLTDGTVMGFGAKEPR